MTEKDFNPAKITAMALDLDGTLLKPDKTLSDRTVNALRTCIKKDIQIILATGRAVDSGEKYRKIIGVSGPQVYYNGAEVVDLDAGKIIHKRFIKPEPILYCVRLARQTGVYFQVFFPAGTVDAPFREGQNSGEILMAEKLTPEVEAYRKSTGIEVIIGDLEEQLMQAPAVIKGMFITNEENNKKIRPILQEQFGNSIYIVQSSPNFLEILAQGVSKGFGLECALEYLKLKPENTIAFGDEENDLPMFKAAGFSAAPANAPDIVRKAAAFQIPANREDGVAVFLEKYFKK